jgi:hypothetical protein
MCRVVVDCEGDGRQEKGTWGWTAYRQNDSCILTISLLSSSSSLLSRWCKIVLFDLLLDETVHCLRLSKQDTAVIKGSLSSCRPIKGNEDAAYHCHCAVNPKPIQRKKAKHKDVSQVKHSRLGRFADNTLFLETNGRLETCEKRAIGESCRDVVHFSTKPSSHCCQRVFDYLSDGKYLDRYASPLGPLGGKNVRTRIISDDLSWLLPKGDILKDKVRDVTDGRDSEYGNQHLGAHFGFEKLKTSKTLHFFISAEG